MGGYTNYGKGIFNPVLDKVVIVLILCGMSFYAGCQFNKPTPVNDITNTTTAEKNQSDVSPAKVEVKKDRENVSVTTKTPTKEYGTIINETTIARKELQYRHKVEVKALALNTGILTGVSYKYRKFGLGLYGGYDIKNKGPLYGVEVNYTVFEW